MASGLRGGYEWEFVDDCIPDSLVCPICYLPLRDPHLLSCCGSKFCEVCIDCVKSSRQPLCPLCKQQFTTMLDKNDQRKVLGLKVRCSNREGGCSWEGELRHLDSHVEKECGATLVKCQYRCGQRVPRRQLSEHELHACPEKTLAFCKEMMKEEEKKLTKSVANYVTNTLKTERERHEKELEKRLAEQKRVLMSDYDAKTRRLEETLNAVVRKVTEMEASLHVLAGKTRDIEELLNVQTRDLAARIDIMKKESDRRKIELERKLAVECSAKMKILEESLRNEVNQVILQMKGIFHIFHPLIGLEFVMTDYSKHKKARDSWSSSPFYTGLGGYKLHLCVSLDSSTLSVWLYPMMGDFDDKLVWPFCADITARLVNLEKDMNHFERTVSIKPQDRVTSKSGKVASPALILSISRSVAESKSGSVQYIRHDRLMFAVTGIVVRSQ